MALTTYRPKTKPFPHQSKATLRAARARNFAFFFEPRCGKSKAALDTIGIWALRGYVSRVLVICPSIALDVWETQIRRHFPYPYWAETFDHKWQSFDMAKHKTPVLRGELPAVEFYTVSREELFRRDKMAKENGQWVRFSAKKHKKYRYRRPKQEEMFEWDPDVVVIDESHEYSKPGSVGSQDAWRLVRRLRQHHRSRAKRDDKPQPWVLLCTGTPKDWRSIFTQFRIMDSDIFGITSAADFDEEYITYGHGKRQWTVVAYKNERRLRRLTDENSFAISAEAAGLANEFFLEKLTYKLPPRAAKMYLNMASEFVAEWEGGMLSAKNAGVKRIRLLQILGGFTTDGEQIHHAALDRFEAFAKLLVGRGESLVVYSRYTHEVAACYRILERVGFQAYRVDGSVSKRDRLDAIRSLSDVPKSPTALSFQHQSGSRAIELVGAAETFYYSLPDGWVQWEQTVKRTHGPRQTRPVRATVLMCPGSIHPLIVRSLAKKEDWHSTLMRNPRRYLTGL